MDAHHVTRKEISLDKTINIKQIVRKSVLSKGGTIIGKVSEVRINPKNLELEGVLIKRDIFRKPLYIGKGYFSHLSHDAIILNIEVSLLIKGKQVLTDDGKILGKVVQVLRKGNSNELQGLIVRSLFSKRFTIPPSAVKYIGKTIILKKSHNANKKYFWQRSE